jgi:predicted metalloendopeptidase
MHFQRSHSSLAAWFFTSTALVFIPAIGHAATTAKPVTASLNNGMDPAIAPGDDFFAFANGGWINSTAIPPDRPSWGVASALIEQTNVQIQKLIGELPAGTDKKNPDRAKVADFYAAYTDQAAIEAKGLTPLKATLQRIEAIRTKQALAHALGASLRADVDPLNKTNFSTENLFGLWVAPGFKDNTHYTPYLLQGGLGMPDRDYYWSNNPKIVALRSKYEIHITDMLRLAGVPDAEEHASPVFELERQIAQSHVSAEESQNILQANNRWTIADFTKQAPGMDWPAYFKGAGLFQQPGFIVWQPSAFKGAAALVASTPLAVWKDYLIYHAINHYADVLPQSVVNQHFIFYGKVLSGTPEQEVLAKRALTATNKALGDAVGKMYTEQYFSAAAKTKAQEMVHNIIAAFGRRIEQLDWMSPATKQQAQAKLKTLYVGIGYPDHWQTYQGLQVLRSDAFGNTARAESFAYLQAVGKLGHTVDRTEWCMAPQEVNAVNMPLQNALNFPAAILQAPFFDPTAPDAVNYASIGAVIGHEISHSFDDQGARFDAQGSLRNWWTEADLTHFKASSQALVAQYSAYRAFPDLAVNGAQTLSENIADLAGLAAAYDAYRATVGGKQTPEQEKADAQVFFTAYGQSWRSKARDASLRRAIITNAHAPGQYRALTVRNMDAWYSAFDVKPTQKLYLAPDARIKIW